MGIRNYAVGIVLALFAATEATAVDGQLDTTFGNGGRAYLGWATDATLTYYDSAVAVLALGDNSLIVVGNATDAGTTYGGYNAIGIAKITPGGAFDTSFGDAATPGQTKIHGGGVSNQIVANAAALQADGKIVIVGNSIFGQTNKQMATVWRLNTDGSVDTSFGFGGATLIDRNIGNQFDSANAVLIVQGVQGTPYASLEGRIVVAGSIDFSPSLIIAQSWIFQLDGSGLEVATNGSFLGSNTYEWSATDCQDGYHDYTFSAIRLNVQPDAGTATYFLTGNCVPRANTGRIYVPFIAAVDPTLNLVQSFGNNDNGISEVTYVSSSNNYSDIQLTSLDVSPDQRYIVFAGYTNATGVAHEIFEGALTSNGQFNGGWADGGATVQHTGGSALARAILIDPYPTALFPFAGELIGGEGGCSLNGACANPYFLVGAYGFGTPEQYCGSTATSYLGQPLPCYYNFNSLNSNTQGINAMTLTPSGKLVVAGYVQINGHTDFGVMRLQRDRIFFNGFGYPSQGFQ